MYLLPIRRRRRHGRCDLQHPEVPAGLRRTYKQTQSNYFYRLSRMAPPTPATHDPTLSSAQGSQPSQSPASLPANLTAADLSNLGISGLDQNQIMTLFRTFPVLAKVSSFLCLTSYALSLARWFKSGLRMQHRSH